MRVIPMILIALLAVSCREIAGPEVRRPALAPAPTTLTLHVGERAVVGDVDLTFIRVSSDSRCPTDVECPWTGNAEVLLSVGPVTGEAPLYPLTLNTDLEPREANAWGLHITLVELRPEPRSNVRIGADSYVVVLSVERAG